MAASLSLTSGAPRLLTIMSCSLAVMSFGVPAGTTTAVQVAPSTSGKPASAMVGTSGKVGDRVLPVTASARRSPFLISGTAGAVAPNEIGVWLPTVASTAGPPPPNGTWTRSRFNACTNSAPVSCGGVPVRGERDRVEIFQRIEAGVREQEQIVGDVAAGYQDRIAVGRRLRRFHRADIAAGAGNVLDEKILAGLGAELLRNQPRHQIGRAAGREADNDFYGPLRPDVGGRRGAGLATGESGGKQAGR